jgi:hypothetical protein
VLRKTEEQMLNPSEKKVLRNFFGPTKDGQICREVIKELAVFLKNQKLELQYRLQDFRGHGIK